MVRLVGRIKDIAIISLGKDEFVRAVYADIENIEGDFVDERIINQVKGSNYSFIVPNSLDDFFVRDNIGRRFEYSSLANCEKAEFLI